MEFTYKFENLDVWKESRKLVKYIYLITSNFPDSELYGLVNQMRRSAISISSNIAEGSGKFSSKSQIYFYNIAFCSAIELLNQGILSNDLNFIELKVLHKIRSHISKITRLLDSLSKSLKKV